MSTTAEELEAPLTRVLVVSIVSLRSHVVKWVCFVVKVPFKYLLEVPDGY